MNPHALPDDHDDTSGGSPAGDPIDAAVLMDMCMDDAALAGSVLATFEQQAPASVGALRDGSRRGDAAEIARVAHAMRGTAGTIGAASMMNAAQQLEHAALQGDLDQIRLALDALAQVVQRCVASVPGARAALAGIAQKRAK